jgi:methionyl aminopeptidase
MSLIKTNDEIIKMREAGRIVAKVHRILKENIKEGITLLELDKLAEETIRAEGATPSFLGFGGFPNSICSSVNEVMVHGIPNNYKLKSGDIVSIDVGAYKDGYHGDAAFTIGVGSVSSRHQELMDVNKLALKEAIDFIKPGITLGELGTLIESFAIAAGFTSAREYTGHGIGSEMHQDPYVPNVSFKGGMVLKEGMTICIEPMFIDGKDRLFTDPLDG